MLYVITFLIFLEYFDFVNLLIKIHTCSTGNFNRSSALAESAFNDLLIFPNPFTEINTLSVVTLEIGKDVMNSTF